jgi:fructose-1,6-bisphosphatase/inositol monophosphatase family enzyme
MDRWMVFWEIGLSPWDMAAGWAYHEGSRRYYLNLKWQRGMAEIREYLSGFAQKFMMPWLKL